MSRPHRRQVSSDYSSPGVAYSSRESYPSFLSFHESALLQLQAAGKGLLDAFRWDTVIRVAASDAEVRSNVFKSLLVNLLSLTSVYFFDLLLLPLTKEHEHWLRRNVGWFYQAVWLFPVVGLSLYLNDDSGGKVYPGCYLPSSWCTGLAKRVFTLQYGSRAAAEPPSTYTGILNSIASSAYRGVMVFTSVVLSFGLRFVPFVGPAIGFVFLCWVDAYYCFELKWIARGYSLPRRLRHLEERWAYYFAFGLPSTALCMWGSTLANAAIFALVYPAFIIMAMHAYPTPIDPYNPTGDQHDHLRHPSPYIPIRIPVFTTVVWFNDLIVRLISLVGLFGGTTATNGPINTARTRRSRALSDSVESVEEGEGVSLEPLTAGPTIGISPGPRVVSTRVRVSKGGANRRKFD